MKDSFIVKDENQLYKVASNILQGTMINKFMLTGGLGVGKTTLVKYFCKQLGVQDVVSSPSFSIINEYMSDYGLIYHFDFYRIQNQEEIFDLGYEEYFDSSNYCFVEWPEKINSLISSNIIEIEILQRNSERIINIARP